jgi:hypothetical protein
VVILYHRGWVLSIGKIKKAGLNPAFFGCYISKDVGIHLHLYARYSILFIVDGVCVGNSILDAVELVGGQVVGVHKELSFLFVP